ncbi:MAG: tetratricopeptide repeat protein [Armatimonadota bacterium]|jgi:tetratricopeptide (TPR) repeat protein
MRAVAIACLLLSLCTIAAGEMTLDERLEVLWDRAIRQTDFANYDDALKTGRRAVEIAPAHADAWALLAYAHWMHPDGLAYLARGQVQRALGLNPASARARMLSGLVIPFVTDPPDFGRAIAELERAVELDPTLAQAWSRLGLARNDLGDTEAALADIRRAVALEPERYEWHLHLGEVLLAAGDADEAVASNRRALELAISPFSELLARNNLAWSLCLMLPADPAVRQEALDLVRELSAGGPEDAELRDTLGTAELLFGEPVRAEEALRAAIELGNNSWAGLAYALALQGESAEAREQLARFSALYVAGGAEPEHPYFAGLAWEALGETQITRRVFESATKKWPKHPWADEMRHWLAGR